MCQSVWSPMMHSVTLRLAAPWKKCLSDRRTAFKQILCGFHVFLLHVSATQISWDHMQSDHIL